MAETYLLETSIAFQNVDREERLTLDGIFDLLQEAAIRHADQHDFGAQAKRTQGDTWFLNRISAAIHRYPRHGETVQLTTWSSGIRAFKGYREFRLRAGEELLLSASSLWLRINHHTGAFVRVPQEIAQAFPERAGERFHPEIEKLRFDEPSDSAVAQEISLRYSDIDINGHVNNAAYFGFVQTALAAMGQPVHPSRIEIHFVKEIPPTLRRVCVKAEPVDGYVLFACVAGSECFTRGRAKTGV